MKQILLGDFFDLSMYNKYILMKTTDVCNMYVHIIHIIYEKMSVGWI